MLKFRPLNDREKLIACGLREAGLLVSFPETVAYRHCGNFTICVAFVPGNKGAGFLSGVSRRSYKDKYSQETGEKLAFRRAVGRPSPKPIKDKKVFTDDSYFEFERVHDGDPAGEECQC